MKYSKEHFRKTQKLIKDAATKVIVESSSQSKMRRVAKLAKIKINYVKYLSKEYALIIKKNKGNNSDKNLKLSVINETIDIILKSSSSREMKRAVDLAIAKLRLFK